MKLHRIVPWWIRKKPIDFCYDDVISDVISGKYGLFACEHDNSTKSYPILMKLHRSILCWVRKNLIDFSYDDVTMTSYPVKSTLELLNTITQPFFI